MARSIRISNRIWAKRLAPGLALALIALTPGAGQAQETSANRAAATATAASTRTLGVDARIPFVNMGSIRDWRADGDDALYVQDQQRNWYRATLMGPCNDLNFAERIGFETRGTNQLDRFATVIVGRERCALSSLVTSAPPPTREQLRQQRQQRAEQRTAAQRNSN